MIDIYNNKTSFLKLKPRKTIYILLFFIIIIIFTLIRISFIKVYDNYLTKGYITCNDKCFLTTFLPSNIEYQKITFNNKNYKYKILTNEISFDEANMISLRKLEIEVKHEYLNEEIVDINFYYNKQRIVEKVKEDMF